MKPNIILITVDCLRSDHVGFLNNSEVKTPNIDTIAAKGHCFSNAFTSGGWTKVAMTSLFSSTHSSMYGFVNGKLNSERPIISEVLSQNGYRTAGFNTNLVCGKTAGFNKGFHTFEDLIPHYPETKKFKKHTVSRIFNKFRNSRLGQFLVPSKPFIPTSNADELIPRAIDWLNEESSQPHFLWLHFMDLHWPYESSNRKLNFFELNRMKRDRREWRKVIASRGKYFPGKKLANRWKKLYAEETETLDTALGTLFANLKKRSDWKNTALCLTSDHGEEMFEHGSWSHSWNQLHKEGTQVPLILKLPFQSKPETHNCLVSQLDISPTLLEIARAEIPSRMAGKNLFKTRTSPIYIEMFGHINSYLYRLAIRDLNYHYIYDSDAGQCFLFSLQDDPTSLRNIYKLDCKICRNFDKLRLSHVSKGALSILKDQLIIGEDENSYRLEEDPLVIKRLRALGYLD